MKIKIIKNITSTVTIIMKLSLSALLLLVIMPGLLQAQSMSEFEQWKKQYVGEFKQYKDEMDKEFANFLNQKWKPFETEKGKVRDKSPKPVNIPVAKVKEEPKPAVAVKPTPQKLPDPKPAIKIKPPVPPVVSIPAPVIKPPKPETVSPIPIVLPENSSEKLVRISFLGYQLSIIDSISESTGRLQDRANQKAIQQDFSKLAQSDYPKTIEQLLKLKKQLKLNDWAYVQLIESFSSKLLYSSNSKNIISWFVMLKSGLDARIAFSDREIFLLVAVKQNLYDIAFFTFGSQKYYTVTKQKKLPTNLYSYDGKYPKKLDISDFSLVRGINTRQNNQIRRLSFSYANKSYDLKVAYNRNTVDFLSTYPQMDINQYFSTPLESDTADSLLSQLRPIVNQMSETEAVNLLLRFVQKAFPYETDQDQFGAENYLFIEETLHYPASDCEDRSIFFSWLVKNLLNIEVIALDFPGHIATAVLLKKPTGQVVRFKGKRYTIADPTYINARVGMKMPQYKNINPKVINSL